MVGNRDLSRVRIGQQGVVRHRFAVGVDGTRVDRGAAHTERAVRYLGVQRSAVRIAGQLTDRVVHAGGKRDEEIDDGLHEIRHVKESRRGRLTRIDGAVVAHLDQNAQSRIEADRQRSAHQRDPRQRYEQRDDLGRDQVVRGVSILTL